MLNVRLACNIGSWGTLPLDQIISQIAKLEFSGVELPIHVIQSDPAGVRALLEQHRIDLSSAVLPVSLSNLDTLEDELAQVEASARLLLDFDCLQLTLVGQPLEREQATAEARTRFVAGCNEAGQRAMQLGMQIMLRNQVGTLFGSRREIESVVAATQPDLVALALDSAELLRGRASPNWVCHEYHSRLASLTFSDSSEGRPVPLGHGDVDIPGVLRVLHASHYTGWFVLDPGGRPRSTIPGDKQTAQLYSAYELARASRKYMRMLWAA